MGFFIGSVLDVFPLGILFSTSGDYAALGCDCRDGAALAIEELNGELAGVLRIEPVFGNPAGAGDRYILEARRMVQDRSCRHIIGTVTSQARKDVIPIAEKHDAQLWYVCPYEGFEANGNVIYTGACPNQHLVPLLAHLLPLYGGRVYLAGANYVWGWEMNRLAREIVTAAGGAIVGERCLPIGDTEIDRLIADVATQRPDFILSNMLGLSNHAFLQAMRDLGQRDPAFRADHCPVVSCDLTECELPEVGPGVADGQLAAASYFDSVDRPENRALKARVAARFGPDRRVTSYFATSYATVRLCVEAAMECGSDDPAQVRAALADIVMPSAIGPLRIDPVTHHAALPFLLGRVAGYGFDILQARPAIVADPYLVGREPGGPVRTVKPQLRVVS